jgi:FkbM family methyltransferase
MQATEENLLRIDLPDKKTGRTLVFYVRQGSSDEKTLKEVVLKRSYARRDFPTEQADGEWLDLGANIGAFTVLVASAGSSVRAYEPDPASFELLKMNVDANGLSERVKLYNKAVVADERKTVTFYVNSAKKNYWRNSIVKPWRGGYSLEVEAVRFDKVIVREHATKMDIEGAEMPILEAMTKFPDRLVFEWSFDIDRSIPRFTNVIAKLRKAYGNVVYGKFDETQKAWKGEWFPPCRTVWCQ